MLGRFIHRGLGILCALALLLAGCSSPLSGDRDTKGDMGADDLVKEPVTLTILDPSNTLDREALDDVIRLHEARYQHVTVQVFDRPGALYREDGVQESALEGVDLLWGWLSYELTDGGYLYDLSQLVIPEYDGLVADHLEAATVDNGQRYQIAIQVAPHQMILFEKMFEEAGVPLPDLDWTYEDLERILLALKAADKEVTLGLGEIMLSAIRSYGAVLYDPREGRWSVDTPEVRSALTMLKRFVDQELVDMDWPARGWTEDYGPALSGYIDRLYVGGLTYHPYPKGPVRRSTQIDIIGPMVTSSTPHPEEAAAFIQTLLSDEAQTIFARRGHRPVVGYPGALDAWRSHVGQRAADQVELSLADAPTMRDLTVPKVHPMIEMLRYLTGEVSLDELLPELELQLNS